MPLYISEKKDISLSMGTTSESEDFYRAEESKTDVTNSLDVS